MSRVKCITKVEPKLLLMSKKVFQMHDQANMSATKGKHLQQPLFFLAGYP